MTEELNADQKKTAEKVQGVLTKKDAAGNWVYTQTECRDFIVACVFEMGLPITDELAGAVEKFMYAVGATEEMDDDEIIERVLNYFKENPLNPAILAELGQFARDEMFQKGHEGYKEVSEQIAALRAAGKTEGVKAPEADSKKPEVKGKVKRGLR